MSKTVSVVIPTLQKNVELLNNLISSLERDTAVKEIIVIDNSIKGYIHNSLKLRVITPEKNIFVNPAWNLGVKESGEDIVALLNDDITIPENFCKNVIEQITPDMGIVGFHRDYIENIQAIMPIPVSTDLFLELATGRCGFFGIAMFFYKTSYYEIPAEMKIFWGDDWLYYWNKKYKKNNYYISGQKIYHWGSLSSADNFINPYSKSDSKLYRKYTKKWWQFIFNIEFVFRGIRITVCGVNFLCHYDKNH